MYIDQVTFSSENESTGHNNARRRLWSWRSVLSLAQTDNNYNLSHEDSNHRSKYKKGEEEEADDDDDGKLTDGGELAETEVPFFVCPSSTTHCRPAGDTNESTSQGNMRQKEREREH